MGRRWLLDGLLEAKMKWFLFAPMVVRAWMRVEMVTMAVSAFGCMAEALVVKRFSPSSSIFTHTSLPPLSHHLYIGLCVGLVYYPDLGAGDWASGGYPATAVANTWTYFCISSPISLPFSLSRSSLFRTFYYPALSYSFSHSSHHIFC
jgi:hypothetical protein